MRETRPLTRMGILAPFTVAGRVLPRRVQRWLGWPVASILLLLLSRQGRMVASNIEKIGRGRYSRREIRRLTLGTFRRYGQYLTDYMSLPFLGDAGLSSMIGAVSGEAGLVDALEAGKGAILVTAHIGHWELGGALLASHGFPVCIATAPEPDPLVLAIRESMRRRIGVRTITLSSGQGALSLVPLLAALRRNSVVALLADRETDGAIVEVPFFDRPTRFPLGPALLARASEAPIVPVSVTLNDKWTYDAVAEQPYRVRRTADRDRDLREATEHLARTFEAKIARHPDQWYNFFDFWQGARRV